MHFYQIINSIGELMYKFYISGYASLFFVILSIGMIYIGLYVSYNVVIEEKNTIYETIDH